MNAPRRSRSAREDGWGWIPRSRALSALPQSVRSGMRQRERDPHPEGRDAYNDRALHTHRRRYPWMQNKVLQRSQPRRSLGVCLAPQSLTNVRLIPTTSSPRTTNGPRIFLTNGATQSRRPGSGSAHAGTVTVQWSTASKRGYAASGTLRACSSSTSRRSSLSREAGARDTAGPARPPRSEERQPKPKPWGDLPRVKQLLLA